MHENTKSAKCHTSCNYTFGKARGHRVKLFHLSLWYYILFIELTCKIISLNYYVHDEYTCVYGQYTYAHRSTFFNMISEMSLSPGRLPNWLDQWEIIVAVEGFFFSHLTNKLALCHFGLKIKSPSAQ